MPPSSSSRGAWDRMRRPSQRRSRRASDQSFPHRQRRALLRSLPTNRRSRPRQLRRLPSRRRRRLRVTSGERRRSGWERRRPVAGTSCGRCRSKTTWRECWRARRRRARLRRRSRRSPSPHVPSRSPTGDGMRREGFDLCDSTHCQVLRDSYAATRAASDVTAGQVLAWQGAPASVFYTASCGGRTERPSAVWRGAVDPPYLPSRRDRGCGGEPRWESEISEADSSERCPRPGIAVHDSGSSRYETGQTPDGWPRCRSTG